MAMMVFSKRILEALPTIVIFDLLQHNQHWWQPKGFQRLSKIRVCLRFHPKQARIESIHYSPFILFGSPLTSLNIAIPSSYFV